MTRMLKSGLIVATMTGLFGAFCVLGTACQKPDERLNSPPQGHTDYPSDLQEPFVYMTDNALLADMCMSSVHFVPRQAELNSLGMRRLKRLAELLKLYGGTVTYDGVDDPAKLASGRIEQIKDVLIAEGIDSERFEIQRGLAGGSGMHASEAILIREASTFQPDQQGKGGGMPGGTGGQGKMYGSNSK